MKTLIFGGSFNPPHLGHFILADEAMKAFSYDRVLFIPSWRPPHKAIVADPGAAERLAMLRAAILSMRYTSFDSSDCEVQRQGISYSIDTLRYLVASGEVEEKPGFLVGDDLVDGFARWKEPEALAREADLILLRRMIESGPDRFALPHRRLENLRIAISSSLIRQRISENGAWQWLLPDAVRTIIIQRGFYGYPSSNASL